MYITLAFGVLILGLVMMFYLKRTGFKKHFALAYLFGGLGIIIGGIMLYLIASEKLMLPIKR